MQNLHKLILKVKFEILIVILPISLFFMFLPIFYDYNTPCKIVTDSKTYSIMYEVVSFKATTFRYKLNNLHTKRY